LLDCDWSSDVCSSDLQIGGAQPPPPAAATPLPRPDLSALALLLREADGNALDWWQQHEPALQQHLSPRVLRPLTAAMARLDFDAALLSLDALVAPPPQDTHDPA
jgi:hypothetical protein